MSTSDCYKDGASKSNDGVCEVIGKLGNMSTADISTDDVLTCVNCGKEGSSDEINNICNKCKQVKYCNAACKKKHRHKHKKECEEHVRLAAERAAELHDETLFKQPQNEDDCPICFLHMPTLDETGSKYLACCGKVICSGCIYAVAKRGAGVGLCPFCRTPAPRNHEEGMKREKKRVDANDALALYNQGNYFRDGRNGFPQDIAKALEFWHRAGELGCTMAYASIGNVYYDGKGLKRDMKKAIRYWELAAMMGSEKARHNLGIMEANMDRAIKHYTIAARSGYSGSLKMIQNLFSDGNATKEDYTKALHSYQEYLGEIRSAQRDKAAATNEDNRYY